MRIRRRLGVSREGYGQRPLGSYIRLRPGEVRREALSLDLPLGWQRVFSGGKPSEGVVRAQQLILELGYYVGNLPHTLRDVLAEAEQTSDTGVGGFVMLPSRGIELDVISLWVLNTSNTDLGDDATQAMMPPIWGRLKGEHVATLRIDGLDIPYEELPLVQKDASNASVGIETLKPPLQHLRTLLAGARTAANRCDAPTDHVLPACRDIVVHGRARSCLRLGLAYRARHESRSALLPFAHWDRRKIPVPR